METAEAPRKRGRPKGSKDKQKRSRGRWKGHKKVKRKPKWERPDLKGKPNPRLAEWNRWRYANPELEKARREGIGKAKVLCPAHMTKAEGERHWRKCYRKAVYLMDELEKEGVVQFSRMIPEDEMARQALLEAFAMSLSDLSAKEKIAAINTVLAYTKAKPAQKTDLRLNNAEAWLAEVVADHKAGNDGSTG